MTLDIETMNRIAMTIAGGRQPELKTPEEERFAEQVRADIERASARGMVPHPAETEPEID